MALPVGEKAYSLKQIFNEAFDGLAIKVTGANITGGTLTANLAGTETRLDTLNTKVSTAANQALQLTEIKAILAKIIAAPATEAKQTAIETILTAVKTAVEDQSYTKGLGAADATTLRTVLADAQAAHLAVLSSLDKNGGVTTANTLRVRMSDEDRALFGGTSTANPRTTTARTGAYTIGVGFDSATILHLGGGTGTITIDNVPYDATGSFSIEYSKIESATPVVIAAGTNTIYVTEVRA